LAQVSFIITGILLLAGQSKSCIARKIAARRGAIALHCRRWRSTFRRARIAPRARSSTRSSSPTTVATGKFASWAGILARRYRPVGRVRRGPIFSGWRAAYRAQVGRPPILDQTLTGGKCGRSWARFLQENAAPAASRTAPHRTEVKLPSCLAPAGHREGRPGNLPRRSERELYREDAKSAKMAESFQCSVFSFQPELRTSEVDSALRFPLSAF